MYGNYYYDFDLSPQPKGLDYTKFVGLDGKPISCTPQTHPYSFDPYVIYKDNKWSINDEAVYSDRMMQWDYNKFNDCAKEVWNDHRQLFDSASPEELEKFLQLYFGSGFIELTAILKGCNQSNGYPYWIFYYKGANK